MSAISIPDREIYTITPCPSIQSPNRVFHLDEKDIPSYGFAKRLY
jgi:hypothetical protein